MTKFDSALLKSYLPVDAVIHEGRPAIAWMELNEVQFTEPFFQQTLRRAEATRHRQRVITDFDVLFQLEKSFDSLQPSGFIFHSSRCGSTLLANACRALDNSIVIAEAPLLDKIISRFFTDAEPGSPKEMMYMFLLRAAVKALGQRRTGEERHYFVKFACASTLQMTRIRRTWPDVPFVFLYREPVEVIVSNLRLVPEWMQVESNPMTAAAIVGADENEISEMPQEEFCARALGRFFSEADANRDRKLKLLNYEQLTTDVLMEAIQFMNVSLSRSEEDAIYEVSRLYSKDLSRRQMFQPDVEAKRALATNFTIEMAEKWAQPFYKKLYNPLGCR